MRRQKWIGIFKSMDHILCNTDVERKNISTKGFVIIKILNAIKYNSLLCCVGMKGSKVNLVETHEQYMWSLLYKQTHLRKM